MPWQQQRELSLPKWRVLLALVQTIKKARLSIARNKKNIVSSVMLSVKNVKGDGRKIDSVWPPKRPSGKRKGKSVIDFGDERRIV